MTMTATHLNEDYAVVIEPAALRLQRLLPGPVERIWSYLTDSQLRARWLAAGVMTLEADAPFELVWRNDDLTDPPGVRPEGFDAEHRMSSRILQVEHGRLLAFAWREGSVTFELEPDGEDVLLTITHRRISDRENMLKVAAGWHAHLGILGDRLRGVAPKSFWATWLALKQEYEARLSG